ncbi:sensor histidine kinase [Nannocystis pusilla]|uniref:sensor histidine kinase n=1 Tax=Nannocystis pusilla TaxID=889268 RepID=UPI003B7AC2CB
MTIAAPEEPLYVDGDAELLRRALDNLLDNARKYSEPGSPITLRAAAEGDEVVLEVADAGIGIDAADQVQVFTPFFRTDRSRTRMTGGVGLGLTLVQRIALAHEGSVALESEPGRGTRVTLRLPGPAAGSRRHQRCIASGLRRRSEATNDACVDRRDGLGGDDRGVR